MLAQAFFIFEKRLEAIGVPFYGVSRTRIDYKPEATAQQRSDGDALLAGFDFEAEQAAAEQRERRRAATAAAELSTLEQTAATAVARCDEIIAGANTMQAAQVRAAVVDLARIVKRLVKIQARTED